MDGQKESRNQEKSDRAISNSLLENTVCKEGCEAESLIFKQLAGRENTKITIFKNPLEFTEESSEVLVGLD